VMDRWRRRRASEEGPPPEAPSDAHPIEEHPRRLEEDPQALRRLKIRRRAITLFMGTVFVAGSVAAMFGEGGWLDMRRLRDDVLRMRHRVERQERRVAALRAGVRRLENDPMSRERVAREQLGLVRPGEVDFLLPRAGEKAGDEDASASP